MRSIHDLALDKVRTMLVGRRVRLVRTTDSYTALIPGDEGTVDLVDDMGTVHVLWDNGSSLGLIPDEDQWTVISDEG